MSGADQDHGSPQDFHQPNGPPYPTRNQGLGGSPDTIPDIPISAVLLVLYLVFGIIHIRILKSNKTRGHKFIFNGAVLGLCKVRLITMSLRMAWASYPGNAGLAIAANVFVYVGTIILFMINWFFVQRIVRAQHTRLGWSTPYRIFHRGALVLLILCLIMLILGNIWQSFTLNNAKLRACRVLVLIGQTYFAVFCFAPAVVTIISLIIPRHEIDKFGAGRLRNNIIILLIAVTVLSVGQISRCVIQWIPQTPVRDDIGRPRDTPWFLSKAAFYCFNFVTEVTVVILYAVVRVDLRFHVPDGSRMSGDYSLRSSRVSVNNLSSKNDLAAEGNNVPMIYSHNDSSETLHKYDHSIFADANTLADSLQYTSSTLEVDCKTGNWKVKRTSTSSRHSQSSLHSSSRSSHQSMHDRAVRFEDESEVPPVPTIPNSPKWPLTDAATKRTSATVASEDQSLPASQDQNSAFELADQAFNNVDMNFAISDALSKLEENSEYNKQLATARDNAKATSLPPSPPPGYETVGRMTLGAGAPLANHEQSDKKTPASRNPLAPRKRTTYPPKSALKTSKPASGSTTPRETHTIEETPEVPDIPVPPPAANRQSGPRRPSSVEFISITRKPSTDSRLILDMSLQGDKAVDVSRFTSPVHAITTTEHEAQVNDAGALVGVSREASSKYSQTTTSSDAREAATAVEEFKRFSYDGGPVSPISEGAKR